MAFNYYYNRSILGKYTTSQTLGIGNINSATRLTFVQYVSNVITYNGAIPTFVTNDITDNSQAQVYGGGISSNSVSGSIEITYIVNGVAYLNWSHSVSSEPDYDYGFLLLNGNYLNTISGEVTTSGKTLMPTGTNTLNLSYGKDGSATSGSDITTATWSFTTQ